MSDKLTVAFRLNGGLGTYLMEENFIQYFFDAFPDEVNISIFAGNIGEQNEGIFHGQYFVKQYFPRSMYHKMGYDLAIDMNWFPKVDWVDKNKLKKHSCELQTLISTWEAFRDDNRTKRFLNLDSTFDPSIYTYAIARGETRLTVSDIGDLLGITRNYRLKIECFKDEENVLREFGLCKGEYITMQQGVNAACRTNTSPRQWPNGHYKELCRRLKQSCPNLVLVQLGELGNNISIEGVDHCLLGKTDFEQLKVILKNAKLHIDGDCGMVHLRKAMHGGPSVVLYGQTSSQVLGYDDDINLTSDVCRHWCGKLFDAWKRRCFLANHPLCMKAITPERVASIIEEYIAGTYRIEPPKPTVLQELLADEGIKLDEEWREQWLKHRVLHAYWLEKVKISDLVGYKLTPKGYIRVPITEMPAYDYLIGDRQSYADYMDLNDRYNPGHEHSIERFERLVESFKSGFNENYVVAVDGSNRILDGAHRACWQAYQKGTDAEITVLKLYGDWSMKW